MKNILLIALVITVFISCNDSDKGPDVSKVNVNIDLKRFDHDFFSIDTNNVLSSVNELKPKYPVLLPIFLQNILGLDSAHLDEGVRTFTRLTRPIQDSIDLVFRDTRDLQSDFKNAFQHVVYYIPQYKVPQLITVTGPVDLMAEKMDGDKTAVFLAPGFLGITLQFYLGKDFSLYSQDYFITRVAPLYRSRRFSKEYIVPDAMKLVADDLFPERSTGRGLIERMIEKGKNWWLAKKFMPRAHDSLITGYTGNQVEFANRNEGMIWQTVITNEKDLYSIDPVVMQNYLGESPYTLTMGENSPGNIGPWIGWQIIKKYEEKNSGLSVADIMRTDAKKIFDEAKYKPK